MEGRTPSRGRIAPNCADGSAESVDHGDSERQRPTGDRGSTARRGNAGQRYPALCARNRYFKPCMPKRACV